MTKAVLPAHRFYHPNPIDSTTLTTTLTPSILPSKKVMRWWPSTTTFFLAQRGTGWTGKPSSWQHNGTRFSQNCWLLASLWCCSGPQLCRTQQHNRE